ncbi:MAG TPA: outer membrane beta-barrel protein [Flavisolibacter sp.]|nr:outer membrane beta-barrel protein [Flavisolibacter sp.]
MKNLRILLMAGILCCSVQCLLAQATGKVGLHVDYNASLFRGGDVSGASALKAFQAGGILALGSGGNGQNIFSRIIQLEINYSRQGAVIDKENIVLNYFNFPLLLQRYFYNSGLYLETGVQLGILFDANLESDARTLAISKQFKKNSFGIDFGTGYKLNSGIGIRLRYSVDVAPIYRDGRDIHNSTMSAGLFYVFNRAGSGYY